MPSLSDDVDAEVARVLAAQAHLSRDEQRDPRAIRFMLQTSPGGYRLNAFQDGRCAICETPGGQVLDHCHETGQIRGWLCLGCNAAEGKSDELIFVLYRLIHPAGILDVHQMYSGRGWRNGWSLVEHGPLAEGPSRQPTPWPRAWAATA